MRRLLLCALLFCGCAASAIRPRGPGLVLEDSSAPFEWRAETGSSAQEVHGETCRNAVGLPLFLIWRQECLQVTAAAR